MFRIGKRVSFLKYDLSLDFLNGGYLVSRKLDNHGLVNLADVTANFPRELEWWVYE